MTTYETRLNAIGRWLQGLLTWTPGQTDIIKTIALVLMVIDHTGLLLAGNNEVMRLLGRGCFPLFGLVWGMNLARYHDIRQSQLNQLWCWALIAQGSFILVGYPWYMGNILFTLPLPDKRCVGSVCVPVTTFCWRSLLWWPGCHCLQTVTVWPGYSC
jgi:type-F conjugative transfer system pilin acetylase TraX